jgi:hypothetical protein
MEPIPLPPKEPISAKLAKTLHQSVRHIVTLLQIVTDSVRSVFTALQQKTLGHPLAKKLANRLLGWGIIGAGVGVAQWDEYGPALGLFLGGSLVLLLQAYHWQGWENYIKTSRILKLLFVIGAVFMIAASYPITNAKRGDKPWSDLLQRFTFVASLPPDKLKPFTPSPPPFAFERNVLSSFTIRTGLGNLLNSNVKIREKCLLDEPPKGFSCSVEEVGWRDKARRYISKNMEPSYLARFDATLGTHMEYKKTSSGRFLQGQESDAVNYLAFFADTLDKFIKEFQN